MQTIYLLFFIPVLVACYPASSQEEKRAVQDSLRGDSSLVELDPYAIDSLTYELMADSLRSYSELLQLANTKRQSWQTKLAATTNPSSIDTLLKEAGKDLEGVLVQGLFPFWYGTPWDFNGISNVPGEGQIACGYFVSTTLKHVGFSLNRYKVAQQSSKRACEIFARGEKVLKISPEDVEALKRKLENLEPGLYCVGLDYHVGFLLKRKDRYFFIHSSYFGVDGVVIEPVETSMAFYSQTYYLSPITTNKVLVRDWVEGREISWNL
ncbi:MAG TPA: hypothetical protein DIW47_10835 [Bacteroidetes bacterium]|nr:hypothetical protein [Bacteroidota bacterium]